MVFGSDTGNIERMQVSTYEKGEDFVGLNTVGVIITNPARNRVLLIGRRDEEDEEDDKVKRRLAFVSGEGTLQEFPDDPAKAASKEIESETLKKDVQVVPFHTYKEKAVGSKKVGFYIAVIDDTSDELLEPRKASKKNPGWFPISILMNDIGLPFEQAVVAADFVKELGKKD